MISSAVCANNADGDSRPISDKFIELIVTENMELRRNLLYYSKR